MRLYLHFFCLCACCIIGYTSQAQLHIYFVHNSTEISSDEILKIQSVALANEKAEWHIEGKASSSGSAEYNDKLSKNRADGVMKILQAAGIPADRIKMTYSGEAHAHQHVDDPTDRVVIIKYAAAETPKKIIEEIPARTFPLDIIVWDALTQKPVSGTYIIDGKTNPFTHKIHVKSNNNSAIKIKISSEGYKDSVIYVQPRSEVHRVELLPNNVLEKMVFGNIYFFPNSPEILPESFRALEDLYNKLKNKTGIMIEIHGHVNWPVYMGSSTLLDKQHQDLSDQRALAVKNWLIKKGIPAEILTHKGFGASKMLYPDAETEGQMAFNRRVEVILLKQ